MANILPFDFNLFQQAVYDWISKATEITVVWRDQGAIKEDYPFVGLLIEDGPTQLGNSWSVVSEFDASRPLNKEIKETKYAPATMQLSCQFSQAAPASRDGNQSARAFATRAIAELQNPPTEENLRKAKVAIQRLGPIQNINAVFHNSDIQRVQFTVLFNTEIVSVEYLGYFASFGLTGEIDEKKFPEKIVPLV